MPERQLQYLRLDPERVRATAEQLQRRISERFTDRNLGNVAADLCAAVSVAQRRTRLMLQPNIPLRIAITIVLVIAPITIIWIGVKLDLDTTISTLPDWIQTTEAALASIVFLGAAAFFLMTFESRVKRRIALRSLDELRALAHIVDMHQLTKDPERISNRAADTASSPKRTLTAFQVSRYLDYCGEMLSLIAKVGELYGQDTTDAEITSAIDDLESLSDAVTQRIWQKNNLLHALYRTELAAQGHAESPTAAD